MIKAAAAVLFWLAVLLLQKLNWQLGVYKALVLLGLLAAVPFVITEARRRADAVAGHAPRLLKAAALILLLVDAGYAIVKLRHPSLIDVATVTIAAGEGLRTGTDPYELNVDAEAEAATHDARFRGYKYLPVTVAAYLPFGAALGPRGIVLANLLFQLAVVALVFRLGEAMASASAGWLAVTLYLSLPMVPFQLFAKGVVDLVPVLPLLAALLLAEREQPTFAGLCVGLSLAAKLLPGMLLLPCALPGRAQGRLRYAAGVAVGLLPVLPFAIWAPGALFDNIVLFNLIRPADSTSWLFAVPGARPVAAVVMAMLYLATTAAVWRRPAMALASRCGMAVVLILASLIAAPAVHHNYQLWWLPLACALLGAALGPQRLPSLALAATKARLGSI